VNFSSLVARVSGGGSTTWDIHFEALRRIREGKVTIMLTVGDPDQLAPVRIVEETVAALRSNHKGYSPIAGIASVRSAIAERIERRTGHSCRAENIIVVPGAQAGLYCVVQCLAESGDEVIVAEPIYATYDGVIGASGAVMINVPLLPERAYHPDIESIENAITPRTRVIWINSPHNPTGAVLDRDELMKIAEICERHDLWLLSDEVYEDLAYARPHSSVWSLPNMAERAVLVSSLSKTYAIPGYRFGWVAGPEILIKHIQSLLLCMSYGSPPFIQEGVLPALREDLPEMFELRNTYRRRATIMSGVLRSAHRCTVAEPEGGMFLFLDARDTGLDSWTFARMLLEQESVAVLPSDAFGPSASGHLRISLTAPESELLEAARRIVQFTRRLSAGGL
jgi:arginine:pyruvate transaminase